MNSVTNISLFYTFKRLFGVCSFQTHSLCFRAIGNIGAHTLMHAISSYVSTGGFTVQSYKGAQKPTPMELMRAQANRITDDPSALKPPKIEMPPFINADKNISRSHNLKPRDMNILTPTGF